LYDKDKKQGVKNAKTGVLYCCFGFINIDRLCVFIPLEIRKDFNPSATQ
jgi:hypothetical protein